jgi:hypothetical protein
MESTDVVTGVTVIIKYEEQSTVPCLVGKAEALTARNSSITTLKIDLIQSPESDGYTPRRQLLALQATEDAAVAA